MVVPDRGAGLGKGVNEGFGYHGLHPQKGRDEMLSTGTHFLKGRVHCVTSISYKPWTCVHRCVQSLVQGTIIEQGLHLYHL